ncbi:CRISPR-associated helicase Cas3' [Candidatus Poribacteria bacterium]|nr:CRISPR-associated helicase Cas3' [Candidatus Poribacteria bacterium]
MNDVRFYSHIHRDETGEIISRKTLQQHLKEVINHGQRVASQMPSRFSENENFRSWMEVLCIGHDFGKFTSYFQKYLLNRKRDGTKHYHGFISALFTAYLTNKAELKINHGVDKYLPLISYLCILHHHGDLENMDKDIIQPDGFDPAWINKLEPNQLNNMKNMEIQVEDILKRYPAIQKIYDDLYPSGNFRIRDFAESWMDFLDTIDMLKFSLQHDANENICVEAYTYLLLTYSILIDADKKSAAHAEVPQKRRNLPSSLVDNFRENSPRIDPSATEGINGIRNEIYNKVCSAVENIDINSHHIMTLTAPTGTGKTLSALSAAVKLRTRIEDTQGYIPRIIYSLPFTSIIDQNFQVTDDVLSMLEDYPSNMGEYLLKHHYLSNVEYKRKDQEMETDNALMLIESWESEIIVTTFVQLLQTVIGYRNRWLKKYHKIAGSIIVLDEVQNIPVEYWQLVSDSLKTLCRELNCYVILLTATKPLLFDQEECIELLEGSSGYFAHFQRTQLKPNMEGISLDDMVQEFEGLCQDDKSLMLVANTIKSSLYLYEKIKETAFDRPTFYLSSNIIPRHRRQRVEEVSQALISGENPILVSTQVVEAGVDLDFDMVIRDLGPIDSIVQVAGRCNRSGKKARSDVHVYNIVNDKKQSLAKYVYGPGSINAAREALDSVIHSEEDYHKLVEDFFAHVKRIISSQKSKDIWKAICGLCFRSETQKCVADFALIESLPNMVDVFVQVDDSALELWERYQMEVIKERDINRKRLNFTEMKADFHSYKISLPKELAAELVPISMNFFLLPIEALENYYSIDTGFKRVPEDTTWII